MHAFDGQTDGRTDGQTEFSSLYRDCIPCSAVKSTSFQSIDYVGTDARGRRPTPLFINIYD